MEITQFEEAIKLDDYKMIRLCTKDTYIFRKEGASYLSALNKLSPSQIENIKGHIENPNLFDLSLFFHIDGKQILNEYKHIDFEHYSEVSKAKKLLVSYTKLPGTAMFGNIEIEHYDNFDKFYKYIQSLIKKEDYIIALYILNILSWYSELKDAKNLCDSYINIFKALNRFDILANYYKSVDALKQNREFLEILFKYFIEIDNIEEAQNAFEYAFKLNPSTKFITNAERELEKKKFIKQLLKNKIDIEHIEDMDGKEFEELLISQFKKLGFKTTRTPITGDYGADIIVETENETKIVIQCKRYKSKVNLKAVQEVVGALGHFQGDIGIVITNNGFLNSAIKLAESNDIELWDSSKLMRFLTDDISFSQIYES